MISWSAAINLMLQSIPAHLMAYWPFRDRLRFPLWKALLPVCLLQIAETVFFGTIVQAGGDGMKLAYVKNNPYLVMLIVQSGPAGMETVQLAKQANSAARLVWFSQQDYALYAFDLRLTFFGLLPVSRSKAASALRACWYEREFPPGISSLSQITLSPQQRISVMGNKKTPSTGVIQA